VKIKPQQVDAFVNNPDGQVRAVLVYGPDLGAVRERAEALCKTVVEDLSDTFRAVELTPKSLISDGARLSDEAAAIAFGGGRRVLRVRGAANDLADRMADFLDSPSGDALIVVEAGELAARSRLRAVFEKADNAAAVPCYVDEGFGLENLISGILKENGLSAEPAALTFLAANLGSDRQLTRRELEKVALYMAPGGTVSLADAEACIGDAAATSLDDVALAAGSGDYAALEVALRRCAADGLAPVAIVRAVQRHFQRLHLAAGVREGGASADQAMAALRPPVFFKQKDAFRRQLNAWEFKTLSDALILLTEAELDCKSTGLPDAAMCGRALMRVARGARQRRR